MSASVEKHIWIGRGAGFADHELAARLVQLTHSDDLLRLRVELAVLLRSGLARGMAIHAGDFDGVAFMGMGPAAAHDFRCLMAIDAGHALFRMNVGRVFFKDASIRQEAKLRGPAGRCLRRFFVHEGLVPALVAGCNPPGATVTAEASFLRNLDRDVRMMQRRRGTGACPQFVCGSGIVGEMTSGATPSAVRLVDGTGMDLSWPR